jgi:hypothetical protein
MPGTSPGRRGGRDDADLAQQAKLIEAGPGLGDTSAGDAVDEDPSYGCDATGRRNAGQLALVSTACGPPGDDVVVGTDLLVERHPHVGEGRPVGADGLRDMLPADLHAIALLVAVIRGRQVRQRVEVAAVPGGVECAADRFSVRLRGHYEVPFGRAVVADGPVPPACGWAGRQNIGQVVDVLHRRWVDS